MNEIPFTKMQGLGNDYLYIDRFAYQEEHDWSALSKMMSNRHCGAGSDGLILVEPSQHADFRMRIFNADGSEGDMCGNGLRCFAKFVYDHEYTKKTEFSVETRAGIMLARVELLKSEVVTVSVDMGEPVFDRASIPISRMDGPTPAVDEPILVDEELIYGTALKLGNPHFVIVVDDVWAVQLNQVGPKLENHPLFPKKANIEFIKIKSSNCLEMRVWERGSGVTLACGTGACGSVVAATLKGLVNRGTEVEVVLPGGILSVQWKDDNHVWQTGPATSVYRGSFFCHN